MLSGRLSGMGRDAECNVSAVKVSLPGTNAFEYANLGIHNEPADLPDGQYEVRFSGRTVPVQRHGGAWIARI
jgi:hypothetical protein